MMRHTYFIILAFGLVTFGACKRNSSALSGFQQFYERFHSDSLFQMEHILFPIDGIPSNADTALAMLPNFQWTAENWQIHRPFNFKGSEYERTLTPFGERVIVEKIVHQSGSFAMVRRFALMDGKWYLIYFADMNPVKKEQPGDSGIEIEGGF